MVRSRLVNMLKVLFREWNGDDNFIAIRLLCHDGGAHYISFCNDCSEGEWCLETTYMHSSDITKHHVIMCVNPYMMCVSDLLVDIRDYMMGYGLMFDDVQPDACLRFYEVFHATFAKMMSLEWYCAEIVDLTTIEPVTKYADQKVLHNSVASFGLVA